MKNTTDKTSSGKENKKVQTGKQFKDNEVREDENNSIHVEANNKSGYPYEKKEDTAKVQQANSEDRPTQQRP